MRPAIFTALLYMAECGDSCPTTTDCPDGTSGGDTSGNAPADPHPGTLVHTDAAGATETVGGIAWVSVKGSTSTITGLELTDQLILNISRTDVSLVTGYPVGTTIEVDAVRIPQIPLTLDRFGTGRVSGVSAAFDVTITEPGTVAYEDTLYAPLPTLTATITSRGFAVARWSDGFGGTFEVR